MTDMRRYMEIAGAAPEGAPAEAADMDMAYDEFGAAAPISAPPGVADGSPVPAGAVESPPAITATVVSDDEDGEMLDSAKKVLAKIAHIVRGLAPIMLKGTVEIEPWMLEKMATAGEALEAVAEHVLDADAILVMISEGQKKLAKKKKL